MEHYRDAWIDVARGGAAAAVVLFHFNCIVPAGVELWRAFWSHGHYGVDVFFVLSGWCITKSWLKADTARDFAMRRMRRIYPPYFASLLLVVAVAGLTYWLQGVNDVTALPNSVGGALASLTLTTTPVTDYRPINWVYWSLSYEMAFYGLLSGVLCLPRPRRVVALLIVHVGLCVWGAVAAPSTPSWLFFVGLWPLFGFGAALALMATNRDGAWLMVAACLAYALTALANGAPSGHLIIGLATGVGLMLFGHVPFPKAMRPMQKLGLFSYSLYLVHVPLGVYVLLRVFPLNPERPVAFIAGQLLALAAVIALAWLFHLFCERPFLRPARRLAPSPVAA